MSSTFDISPARRSRLSQEIVVQLCQMIRQGQLRLGDRLPPERELAERLRVSRASVREALRALEIAGITESRHGGGTYIRDVLADGMTSPLALALGATGNLINDLWEMRIIVEPAVVALAARRATIDDERSLDEITSQQEWYFDPSVGDEQALAADRAFHIAIARASGNEAAVRVVELINQLLEESRRLFGASVERRRQAHVRHREIIQAIRERDALAAHDVMLQHLEEVQERIVVELVARGGGEPDGV